MWFSLSKRLWVLFCSSFILLQTPTYTFQKTWKAQKTEKLLEKIDAKQRKGRQMKIASQPIKPSTYWQPRQLVIKGPQVHSNEYDTRSKDKVTTVATFWTIRKADETHIYIYFFCARKTENHILFMLNKLGLPRSREGVSLMRPPRGRAAQ